MIRQRGMLTMKMRGQYSAFEMSPKALGSRASKGP